MKTRTRSYIAGPHPRGLFSLGTLYNFMRTSGLPHPTGPVHGRVTVPKLLHLCQPPHLGALSLFLTFWGDFQLHPGAAGLTAERFVKDSLCSCKQWEPCAFHLWSPCAGGCLKATGSRVAPWHMWGRSWFDLRSTGGPGGGVGELSPPPSLILCQRTIESLRLKNSSKILQSNSHHCVLQHSTRLMRHSLTSCF